jgi:hypothetical protein
VLLPTLSPIVLKTSVINLKKAFTEALELEDVLQEIAIAFDSLFHVETRAG